MTQHSTHHTHHRKKLRIKKKWYFLFGSGLLIILIIFSQIFDSPNYELELVARADVRKSITATGQIYSKETAVLSFPVSGIVEALNFEVGDGVEEGQLIAKLRAKDIERQLVEARADLDAAQTSLDNELQDRLDQAEENQQALSQTYEDAPGIFSDIYILAQQAQNIFEDFIDSDGDELIKDIKDSVPDRLNDKVSDVVWPSRKAVDLLAGTIAIFSSGANRALIDSNLEGIRPELLKIRTALLAVQESLYDADEKDLGAAVLSSYRADATSGIDKINDALDKQFDLSNDIANQSITNQFAFNDAQAQYASQSASVDIKVASLARIAGDLSDTDLKSPVSGVIARRSVEVGERVTSGQEVYYVIDDKDLELRANIPEVDVGDVSSALLVQTSLDALSFDELFDISLQRVDPDQTNLDGVVYYRSIFTFDGIDQRFKPGMTANLEILVDERKNVLAVPRRAIKGADEKATVRVLTSDNKEEEREVQIGLKGDFLVEIISGLLEGEQIILGEND